jgi:hypothetical protein
LVLVLAFAFLLEKTEAVVGAVGKWESRLTRVATRTAKEQQVIALARGWLGRYGESREIPAFSAKRRVA